MTSPGWHCLTDPMQIVAQESDQLIVMMWLTCATCQVKALLVEVSWGFCYFRCSLSCMIAQFV